MYSLPSISLDYRHFVRPHLTPYVLPTTQVNYYGHWPSKKFKNQILRMLTLVCFEIGFFDWKCLHCSYGGT